MATETPFMPRRGGNQKVTASTTSAAVTIGPGELSLRVLNAGAVVGYFVTYDSTKETRTATSADTPIGPAGAASSTLVIQKPREHNTVAYLSDSATSVMHFQPGEGGV